MDDLSRIEETYGSVAEYNRVMFEEEGAYREPDYDEKIERDNMMAVYNAKIEYLDGIPSDFIVTLKTEWDEKAPKWNKYPDRNSYISAGYVYSHDKTLDIIDKVCKEYSVSADDEWATFYRPGVSMFGISVEYYDYGRVYHKHIGNLNYETFKNIFRDLHYAGLAPTMSYEKVPNKPLIVSNCSLGNLRISYLKSYGIETDDSLNAELESLGFDEEKIIEENIYRITERSSKKI